MLHGDVTRRIIGAAFEVHAALGPGFVEAVYEEALVREFERRHIAHQRQIHVPIFYKGEVVGMHRLDLLVEDKVIVELKTVKEFSDVHTAFLLSYLTATNLAVGLLLNFAKPSLEYKRLIQKPPERPPK